MTKFSKKELAILILIALALFLGMTTLIFFNFPSIYWDYPPPESTPLPGATFTNINI